LNNKPSYFQRRDNRREQYPHRINQRIRAQEVFVIIGDSDEKLGVMKIGDALVTARRHGLDLVEIAPNASPPVCKILDYHKFRYEQAKRERENKKSTATQKLKELKFHINISTHDYGIKLRHAEGFLMKGMKVKILMQFRGREMVHKEIGIDLMGRIKVDLAHVGTGDFSTKMIGKSMTMMLTPLPASKRVRKLTADDEASAEEEGTELELADPGEGSNADSA
jgi:translation initiation factor IF-3